MREQLHAKSHYFRKKRHYRYLQGPLLNVHELESFKTLAFGEQ